MAVDRDHAPDDLVDSRWQRFKGDTEYFSVGGLRLSILPIHPLALLVENLDRAEGGFERLGKPEFYLDWWGFHRLPMAGWYGRAWRARSPQSSRRWIGAKSQAFSEGSSWLFEDWPAQTVGKQIIQVKVKLS